MRTIKRSGIVMIAILMITLSAFAQARIKFTIHGKLQEMPRMPARIYLIYASFLHQPVDSAVVSNGNYEFSGQTDDAIAADVSLTRAGDAAKPQNKVTLILEGGEINIVSTGTLDQAVVTGPGAKATNEFNGILTRNREEMKHINLAMQSDSFKNDAEFKKKTIYQFNYALSSSLNNLIVYARTHPASAVSPYVSYMLIASGFVTHAMSDTLSQNIPDLNKPTSLRTAIVALVTKQKEEDNKKAAANAALDNKIPLGSVAPDFIQTDVNGKQVSLSSFRGKYVLVDFWASWCGPCRAENPNVVQAYNTYKDKGFTVLGVSLDGKSTRAAWLAAIKKDGLTWTEVSDLSGWNNEAAKSYGVHAIPQNFLVNPDGKVIGKNLRGDELSKKLADLFN